MRKVNETLREVLAEEVLRLKDPGLGFLTITEVDTAPDLRSAVVYYTVLGSPEEREATAAALERARARLQHRVATGVRLKYTPRLRFAVDPAVERGLRINAILHELATEEDGVSPSDEDVRD